METVKIKFIKNNDDSNKEYQNQHIIYKNNDTNEPPPLNFLNLDNKFLQIQNIIEKKRNFLLNNQKKIHKLSKQNTFLEEVKEDYSKYNNYIIKQKNDQMNALNMLNTYIHDLSTSNDLSKDNIIDSEHEQQKIMREIKSIKQNLDNIIKPLQN